MYEVQWVINTKKKHSTIWSLKMSSRVLPDQQEEQTSSVFYESCNVMSESQEALRNSRSYSSKSQTQQFLFPSRLKRRTLSLPSSKPVIAHFLTVQDHLNKRKTDSEEDRRELNKGNMAWYTPLAGLSCSLVIYFWACALAYYSDRWPTGFEPVCK